MKLACCGDNCNFCPRYTATLSNDVEKLKEIAILWKNVGWRKNVDAPEELRCLGCEFFTEPCAYNVKECCKEKNIENCGKCIEYPCLKIKKAFERIQINAEKFKGILSKEMYEIFHKAFFLKQENLDKIRNE